MKPFRCSSLSQLMGEPRKKGETLSETAKSHVLKVAKQVLFGVEFSIQNKYVEKGNAVEQDSIDLLNLVRGTAFKKNSQRLSNVWVTGEADIVEPDFGIDIKSPWSLETFPITSDEADKPEYEWQARGYMMLYQKPRWEVIYCMVDTPPELMRYEPPQMHICWGIPPEKRITGVEYRRDVELEAKIIEKVTAAQELLTKIIESRIALHDLARDLNNELSSVVLAPPDWSHRANKAARAAFNLEN